MNKSILGLSAIVLPWITPAYARVEFAQYEGNVVIQEGKGGTKTVRDGVEFWTTGSLPHKYKIVGILIDSRHDKALSGHAVGSAEIAKKVRFVGADAVILDDQATTSEGFAAFADETGNENMRLRSVIGREIHLVTSKFIVIRYVD